MQHPFLPKSSAPPFHILFSSLVLGSSPVAAPPKVPEAEKHPSEFSAAQRPRFLALISLPQCTGADCAPRVSRERRESQTRKICDLFKLPPNTRPEYIAPLCRFPPKKTKHALIWVTWLEGERWEAATWHVLEWQFWWRAKPPASSLMPKPKLKLLHNLSAAVYVRTRILGEVHFVLACIHAFLYRSSSLIPNVFCSPRTLRQCR